MLNREPIFVNGLSRGGTTILTNLLASHPAICLVGETHHVFKGTSITDSPWGVLRKCLCYDAPIILRQQQDFFSPRLIQPRTPLSSWAKRRVDAILYREKLRSDHPLLNGFKDAENRYTHEEIHTARLLAKNIDGMIFANDAWAEMYPDASFFGLVRNGLAICEGHMRRGRSATAIGRRYQILVDKMLDDSRRLPRYSVIRFESLLAAPRETLRRVCEHVGLRSEEITQIRMQTRRVMDADGNHRLCGNHEWDVVWLRPDELVPYFQRDVDRNQIRRLTPADRDAFLREAGRAMEQLGYSDSLSATANQEPGEPCILPFARTPLADRPTRGSRAA
jgi:hypothetical protein